ncbi:TetR/AcrR family transcriptional regulator [Streptomyces sp. NPDC101160]|uniref:TetR/AcrR family transcriptional regulator n=1 Tax=Streptomyces sp. NPDC101160 TaxID=3366118 RepID=UPI0038268445
MTAAAPARPRRPGRLPRSRATLLDCAVQAFVERGYEGTSMEHLAARLSISKSSIYHHVLGKAELYVQALDEAAAHFAPVLDAVAAPCAAHRGTDRLAHFVRTALELPADGRARLELLLSIRDGREEAPGALARRRHLEARVADLVALAARESAADEGVPGHVSGRFSEPVPVGVRTRLLLDLLCSLLVQRRLGRLPDGAAGDPAALARLATGCVR